LLECWSAGRELSWANGSGASGLPACYTRLPYSVQ